ncbi:18020_t:CDS:2, partial [Gigaspora margarita]
MNNSEKRKNYLEAKEKMRYKHSTIFKGNEYKYQSLASRIETPLEVLDSF